MMKCFRPSMAERPMAPTPYWALLNQRPCLDRRSKDALEMASPTPVYYVPIGTDIGLVGSVSITICIDRYGIVL